MRIDCPYCGARDSREFTILGDASPIRPSGDAADALSMFNSYLHERQNIAGLHRELWFHGSGCHAWLVVTRDTRTHAIESVESAASRVEEQRS